MRSPPRGLRCPAVTARTNRETCRKQVPASKNVRPGKGAGTAVRAEAHTDRCLRSKHVRRTHACFLTPGPPFLGLSRQFMHEPQSRAWGRGAEDG